MRNFGFVWLAAVLAGCSSIATVKETTPRLALTGTPEEQLAAAQQQLSQARKLEATDPIVSVRQQLLLALGIEPAIRSH